MHDANALSSLPLCARRLCSCSLCSVYGLLLCSALALMQRVQRMQLLQLVLVLALLVTKNKGRACVTVQADGAQGIDTATPDYAIYEYWAMARPVCWAMARPPGWCYCVCYYMHYV